MSLLLTVVVLLVLVTVSTRVVYNWSRLRHIPGPRSAGWSKWWLLKRTWNGTIHMETAEQIFKHGPLVRIGPNELVTCDPETLRKITAVRTPYLRSDWYDAIKIDPDRANILSERNVERHQSLRARMAPGYAGKENLDLEKSIDEVVASFIQLIETKYLSTDSEYRPLDFCKKAQYLTLDLIGKIAFGRPFEFIQNDTDMFSYLQTTENTIPVMMLVSVFPLLAQIFQSPLLKSVLPKNTDAYGLGRIMGLAKEVVQERFVPDAKRKWDMLGSFVAHGLSQEEAESETLVQILAGSDTTASAIRAIILHVITNPRVQTKLLNEIAAAKVSKPVTDAEAKALPYLQAVIKEGLRIHPPVTGLMLKVVPPQGDNVLGYYLPPGTKIGYSAFGLFLNPKIWGNDAKIYRPERWLEGTAEERRRKENNLELVFGGGRSQCLGKAVAAIELNKVILELLRNFDFTVADPQKPWTSFSAGVFFVTDMWLRVTKREPQI
ncbi:hypothetical protein PV10_08369 [Exophiala mesophila]|uniref:Pisatin demethylase n=1 Tax=Exophiala mesophila TaxID=212818 RepID=A0A0D1XKI3_EXOME|nr:uncharacterized protein PV10_08369 [Exophiala mesophila]KIV88711.1 hypothetical protein PV10_08369 [Exophiala mesophila]